MSSASTNLESAATGTAGPQPAWKRELNDKIAAARAKRLAAQQASGGLKGEVIKPGAVDSRASRVAATVAARYAQAPSYSEYMASEIRTAMTAAAMARAAANLELEAAEVPAAINGETAPVVTAAPAMAAVPVEVAAPVETPAPIPVAARSEAIATPAPYVPSSAVIEDPFEEALITPATPLPAKLLEFPRELVAARKARPRHAEGPLREENQAEPQLRIFEVEPETISTTVEPVPHATEWSSIRLDAYPASYNADYAVQSATDTVSSTYSQTTYPGSGATPRHASPEYPSYDRTHHAAPHSAPHFDGARLVSVASLEDRLMAALIDTSLVGIAFLLFAFVFAFSTVHPPTGRPALVGSAIVIAGLYLLYQFLFFTFSNGTPGMLYARIALCTFDDANPTRHAMRKRIFALVLAGMPLGLGFLYALFDEDNLCWHDRMTRMYQRSYK